MFTRKQNNKRVTKTTYKRCRILKDDQVTYSHNTVAYVQPLYTSEVHPIDDDDNNETENTEDDGHSSYHEE